MRSKGKGLVETHLVFAVSREPVRPPRQETLFLAGSSRLRELLVFRVLGSLPCDSFFFPPLTPTASPPPALSEGLDPGERTVVVLAGGFFFAFAIQPLSPSRFLPPDVSPCALLARPERKSWELNECRVPLEGSLSMPTRETPVLAS